MHTGDMMFCGKGTRATRVARCKGGNLYFRDGMRRAGERSGYDRGGAQNADPKRVLRRKYHAFPISCRYFVARKSSAASRVGKVYSSRRLALRTANKATFKSP